MRPKPELLIRLKRSTDGIATLSCTRADGTASWQRQTAALSDFFPPHDLTHYAVETTLGYHHGFFGLVADGWDISDFAAPWPHGRLPVEALEVEMLVGMVETVRRSGRSWTGDEFRAEGAAYAAGLRGPPVSLPPITDDQLELVMCARAALLERWLAIVPGESLELRFARCHRSEAKFR